MEIKSYTMTEECLTRKSNGLTTKNTVSSLRGTKQSRMMKQKRINKNEGCKSLAGILDCFGCSSLAMTKECLTKTSSIVRDCFSRASLAMTTGTRYLFNALHQLLIIHCNLLIDIVNYQLDKKESRTFFEQTWLMRNFKNKLIN
jgi:hypothetical protein